MLKATAEGFSTKWFPYLLVPRLFWAESLPGVWSLSLVSFSLPCLGAFFLLFLALFWMLSFYKV
jgi:hypothetical protein